MVYGERESASLPQEVERANCGGTGGSGEECRGWRTWRTGVVTTGSSLGRYWGLGRPLWSAFTGTEG